MQEKAYDFIENNEDTHWWFCGKKDIVIDTILNTVEDRSVKLLDYGCGSGYFLSHVSKYISDSTGLEVHNYNDFKFKNIVSDIKQLEKNSFNIIVSLDVLEHIENEDEFFNNLKSLLKNNGKVILTVPANQWMYSEHDVVHNHYRRYSVRQLKDVIIRNGFNVTKISYFNTMLFLPALLVRLIEKIKKSYSLDDGPPVKILNDLFYKIFSFEKYLLRKINMPFGVSLIAICEVN